jgi:hypothetical protein
MPGHSLCLIHNNLIMDISKRTKQKMVVIEANIQILMAAGDKDMKKNFLLGMDFMFEESHNGVWCTIQQYKDYYQLSIGFYV